MKEYWKIGELAALAGLTIRTLRYYDQINLLSPSEYTESGHRLYTNLDLSKLQQILALKQMGLSLHDISSVINNKEKDFAISIIESQVARVKSSIQAQQNLLTELERALRTIRNRKIMSIEEITNILGAMKLHQDKYFSKEQLEKMKVYYDQYNENDLNKVEQKFHALIKKLQKEKNNGTPPTNHRVRLIAKKWREIIYSFTGDDQALIKQAEAFHAENPNNALRFGLDEEIYMYIQEALS